MTKYRMDLQTAREFSEVNRSFARTKTVAAQIKTSPTDGSGRFVALVSTFHREPDVMGDVVDPHAFDRTIIEARAKHPQNLWPVWWQHGYDSPENSIGVITDAFVTDEGLVVEGRLAVDSNAKAMEVYRGLLEDRIREWSISYGVIREHREKIDDRDVNVLDELELLEISSVMAGANRYTRTIEVKATPARGCACSALQLCKTHRIKLDASRPRTKRAGRCVTCGKTQTWNVQHPVAGGTVPWAQCTCGALVGWSGKMWTADHIAEMKLVRAHVDAPKVDPEVARYKRELESILADWSAASRRYERVGGHDEVKAIQAELAALDPNMRKIRSDIGDRQLEERIRMTYDRDLLDQLNALDPVGATKHTQRVTDRASDACRDGAAVADAFRESVTFPAHPTHDSRLLRIAVALRGFAERLAAPGNDLERVARQAVQSGQAMLEVAKALRDAGIDVGDLVTTGGKIVAACEVLVERRLAPPPAVELSGPKAVPAFDARFREIDGELVPDVVGETVTLDVAGTVEEQQTTVQGEGDTWRVPVDLHERNLIDGEQIRIEQ